MEKAAHEIALTCTLLVTTNKKENEIFSLWGLFPKDTEIITKRSKSISSWLKIILQRVISLLEKKLEKSIKDD